MNPDKDLTITEDGITYTFTDQKSKEMWESLPTDADFAQKLGEAIARKLAASQDDEPEPELGEPPPEPDAVPEPAKAVPKTFKTITLP